jgi:hypothetical protein
MITTVVAWLALGPVALPRTAAEAQGTYIQWTGFANYIYRLRPAGNMTLSFRPDHPGGKTWAGTWKFEHGCVHIALPFRQAGKVTVEQYQAVPVAWGDRLMLVDAGELLSGSLAAKLKRFGKVVGGRRFGDGQTDLMVPIRADSESANLPRVYGRPRAPEPFQSLFAGLSLPG